MAYLQTNAMLNCANQVDCAGKPPKDSVKLLHVGNENACTAPKCPVSTSHATVPVLIWLRQRRHALVA